MDTDGTTKYKLDEIDRALMFAEMVLNQNQCLNCKIAANGPTIGQLILKARANVSQLKPAQ